MQTGESKTAYFETMLSSFENACYSFQKPILSLFQMLANRLKTRTSPLLSGWNPSHLHEETDTDNTDDDHDVGGLGKFSHKSTVLSHQHWVDQVICTGGFNVGCTQAAEASHKIHMRLASLRVRHRRDNETTKKMQEYLCQHTLFEKLVSIHESNNQTTQKTRRVSVSSGVSMRLNISMGTNLTSTTQQREFLHRQVRVARVELLDLLCNELQVPKSRQSYSSFSWLSWNFGQKLTMPNGVSYWATDTSYTSGGVSSPRRDVFLLRGSEEVIRSSFVMTLIVAFCNVLIVFLNVGMFF